MFNPESVLEDEMHKVLWDFENQTDHLVSARRPNLVIINNKSETLPNSVLCLPGRPQRKNKRQQKKKKKKERNTKAWLEK